MENIYPVGPTNVPPNLSKPKTAYQQRAILATAGLLLFGLLYCLLTGWFIWRGYRLLSSAFQGGSGNFEQVLSGLCAVFLAVFMVKALFRVKHNYQSNDIEISPQEEPRLFEFLYRLADEAQAPRPHRVFLSPRVNASVFYDLSVLNLIFPSKKNLEIGLSLVNVLTLGELKAVLAHEFGHFAQRSMAVGRWVYIAQQIAGHIVAERDALDKFLQILSRFDIRIAWIGWLLSMIVWSIRSFLETVFNWVVLAQRALSREMEFQADLVAVSLTGSDALIHALHRLHAADDAWDRTLSFAGSTLQSNCKVQDLFSLQTRMIERVRVILDDAAYGQVPPLPTEQPEQHRVFQTELTEPPRMWATHPPNVDREQNAKRTYIAAPIDDRPAWILFQDPQRLREDMTTQLLSKAAQAADMPTMQISESLTKLDQNFDRLYLDRAYRGTYLGRSVVHHATSLQDLYEPLKPGVDLKQQLADLYPESITRDLEELRILEKEKASLQAIHDRRLDAVGGSIKHRGKSLKRRDLPATIQDLDREIVTVQARVLSHDRHCRTIHRVIAARLNPSWEAYLLALAHVLHYTDHTEANLRDAQGYVSNVVAVITADRNVSRKELKRLLEATDELYRILARIYDQSSQVQLDPHLASAVNAATWSAALGEFKLPPPSELNINDWMRVIDEWVDVTATALSTLKLAALEQLLRVETIVAHTFRDQEPLPLPPPTTPQAPEKYPVLLPGQERKRQTRLGWWDRFQTADGWFPEMLRFLVAGTVIVTVFLFNL